jgi:hypothetical protein
VFFFGAIFATWKQGKKGVVNPTKGFWKLLKTNSQYLNQKKL